MIGQLGAGGVKEMSDRNGLVKRRDRLVYWYKGTSM